MIPTLIQQIEAANAQLARNAADPSIEQRRQYRAAWARAHRKTGGVTQQAASVRKRIMQFIASRKETSPAQIREHLNLKSKKSVDDHLSALWVSGQIDRIRRGWYAAIKTKE